MISREKEGLVRELLETTRLSHRRIAAAIQVSTTTVGRIARTEAREHRQDWNADEEVREPPVRCPGCGGRLQITPCRLCRVRALAGKRALARLLRTGGRRRRAHRASLKSRSA